MVVQFSRNLSGTKHMRRNLENGQMLPIRLTGERFSLLLVIRPEETIKGNVWWLCECNCGRMILVKATRLTQGTTKSCGCLKKRKGQNMTHGLRKHPLYRVWRGMKYRCLVPSAHNYPDYGGRGITVCDRWLSIENFYNDMLPGYIKGLHLGRINNDGDYCPENCRWETPEQNNNNRRCCVMVTFDGRTHTIAEWAKELVVKANTISARIRRGRKDYEALFGDKPIKTSAIQE